MTARALSELLKSLLNEIAECRLDDVLAISDLDEKGQLSECQAETFRECGLLIGNDGIVLSMVDGSEFQITVVRSR